MKNHSQIEAINLIYEGEVAFFESKLKPIVNELTYQPHYSYTKDNVLELLRQVNSEHLSPEGQELLALVTSSTSKLLNVIHAQNKASIAHNAEIQSQLDEAKHNYYQAIIKVLPPDLKEMADCLVIRKRHIYNDDIQYLATVYQNLGLDYVQMNEKIDFVFYNRQQDKFAVLAKSISDDFMKYAKNTQEIYRYIQNMPLSNDIKERVPVIIQAYSNKSLIV
jgi:hypothetical protein